MFESLVRRPIVGAEVCRNCAAPARADDRRPRQVPPCQTVLSADELERGELFYPLHVRVCEQCWLAQIPEFVTPEEIFTEYAYFSAYSDCWVEHARRYVEAIIDAWSSTRTASSSSSPRTTAICCSTSCRRGPGARHRAGAECRRGGGRARSPDPVEFFGVELAERLVAEGRRADLVLGNNVLAQVPDLNDFVAGLESAARAGRHRDVRVPASRAADRGQPVRHDLPRALLVLLALHDRARSSRRTGLASRRGGASDATAARSESTSRHAGSDEPATTRPSATFCAREDAAGCATPRALPALRPQASRSRSGRCSSS